MLSGRLALGGSLRVDFGGQLHEPGHCMVQKRLVGFAVVAFFAEVVLVERGAIFHAATSTDRQMAADEALVAQVALGPGEGSLFLAGC